MPEELLQLADPTAALQTLSSSNTNVFAANISSTITPSLSLQEPIKFFPTVVGLGHVPQGTSCMSGMSTSNATNLPDLANDPCVLETPSLVVPYNYEKPPEHNDEDDDSEDGSELIEEAVDDLTTNEGTITIPAAVASQSVAEPSSVLESYFESPLGKFFMDIGLRLVQESVQSDLIRLNSKTETKCAISPLSDNVEDMRKKNEPFKFTMKRCEFCSFETESVLVMSKHYDTPHRKGPLRKCNYCTFAASKNSEIVHHMETVHSTKVCLAKPMYYPCPNCKFEHNSKFRLERHQLMCAKDFRPELNLAPPDDWEAPAKIQSSQAQQEFVSVTVAHQAKAANAAVQTPALATTPQKQTQVDQAGNMQDAALAPQNKLSQPVLESELQFIHQQQQKAANSLAKTSTAQTGTSINSLTRLLPSSSKMPPKDLKTGQSSNNSGSKLQVIACEICDGHIEDLQQLKDHMQGMHKIEIRPKVDFALPPVTCSLCQFRCFTVDGLERHLLVSHGLVTERVQEAANKGTDAYRCPMCTKFCETGFLKHLSSDHEMALKSARLCFLCTNCRCAFESLKLFDTHVCNAHTTVGSQMDA